MDKQKIKPKLTAGHIIVSVIRIFVNEKCPYCRSKDPYYNDCDICEGYVVGHKSSFTRVDCLIKYLAWLQE